MLGSNLSRLKIVTVGEPPQIGRIELYKRAIALGLGNVLRKLEVVPYDFPPLERIEASLLTGALAQDVGGHILAITDADLFEDECADFSSFMFGWQGHPQRRRGGVDAPAGRTLPRART